MRSRAPGGLPRRLAGLLLIASSLPAGCAERGAGAPGAGNPFAATLLRTEEERAGERIYRRERCDRCHALRDTPPRPGTGIVPGGAPPGGFRGRVGPDLGLEGHRRSDDWQFAHLYAPSVVVPGSRMPAYRHLFLSTDGRPTPTREGRSLVAYLQALGRAERDFWSEWRRREPAVPDPPPTSTDLRDRGQTLYLAHCAACHGAGGDGKGEAASLLWTQPRDLVQGQYRFKSTPGDRPPRDADLYRTITLGTGTGTAMPGFHDLSERDRWALVLRVKEFSPRLRDTPLGAGGGGEPEGAAWVETQAPAGRTAPQVEVDRGREVWNDLGCASCHGAGGEGSDAAAGLRHACGYRGGASPAALARAITFGIWTEMPAFGEAIQDGESLRPLLAFLASLDAVPPEARPSLHPTRCGTGSRRPTWRGTRNRRSPIRWPAR